MHVWANFNLTDRKLRWRQGMLKTSLRRHKRWICIDWSIWQKKPYRARTLVTNSKVNEFLNGSINESINESINQWWINRSMNPSIHWPIKELINQRINPTINRSINLHLTCLVRLPPRFIVPEASLLVCGAKWQKLRLKWRFAWRRLALSYEWKWVTPTNILIKI